MKLFDNQIYTLTHIYCEWVQVEPRELTEEKIYEMLKPYFDDFSTLNSAFLNFFYCCEDRRVALTALRFMYEEQVMHLCGVNPIMHDYLDTLRHDEFMLDTLEYYRSVREKQDEVEDYAEALLTELWQVQNHLAVGAEMGLEGRRLAVYDALVGVFSTNIRVNEVRATRELNEWLFNATFPYQNHDIMTEKVKTRLQELTYKYGLNSNISLTTALIVDDIMGWSEERMKELYRLLKSHFKNA